MPPGPVRTIGWSSLGVGLYLVGAAVTALSHKRSGRAVGADEEDEKVRPDLRPLALGLLLSVVGAGLIITVLLIAKGN